MLLIPTEASYEKFAKCHEMTPKCLIPCASKFVSTFSKLVTHDFSNKQQMIETVQAVGKRAGMTTLKPLNEIQSPKAAGSQEGLQPTRREQRMQEVREPMTSKVGEQDPAPQGGTCGSDTQKAEAEALVEGSFRAASLKSEIAPKGVEFQDKKW